VIGPFIEPATIRWTEDGQPVSARFDDPYFSRINGLEETRHVFLNGNQLTSRWSRLNSSLFTIGETGFGSGLNFIAAWQLWQQQAPPGAHLYFISTELFPLKREDLIKSSKLWPELKPWYGQLIKQYPVLTPGLHLLRFDRISLLLFLGDAYECLQSYIPTHHPDFFQHNYLVDAWFLDGFAPSKNKNLWQTPLFHQMARLSRPDATLATFTAAGDVRRNLQAAGFKVSKQTGYGSKREMICARFQSLPDLSSLPADTPPASTPWHLYEPVSATTRQVTVVGAGIAGCCSAYALAQHGFQVTLIDRHAEPAQEASGNKQAILYGKLAINADTFARFSLSSYLYALRFYRQLKQRNPDLCFENCGVLQLPANKKESDWQQQLQPFCEHYPEVARLIDIEAACELAGISVTRGGMYFPEGGWLHPENICQHLLRHSDIQCEWNTHIDTLKRTEDGWQLCGLNKNVIHECQQVVIACGADWQLLPQTAHLPLKKLRGQVSHLTPGTDSARLNTVLSGKGYLAPAYQSSQSLGATYTPRQTHLNLSEQEHRDNLQQLKSLAPTLYTQWQLSDIQGGRAQFRTTSPDYLPVCGPVPNYRAFVDCFRKLGKDARQVIARKGPCWPGLYFIGGLGSRGMSYAPLCGELIASYLDKGPLPLPGALVRGLHPARFVIRDIIRQRLPDPTPP
jgi:tRNA 5-methylaminomethyl-2-thiouridine biosynthesis bifunctional protein